MIAHSAVEMMKLHVVILVDDAIIEPLFYGRSSFVAE